MKLTINYNINKRLCYLHDELVNKSPITWQKYQSTDGYSKTLKEIHTTLKDDLVELFKRNGNYQILSNTKGKNVLAARKEGPI